MSKLPADTLKSLKDGGWKERQAALAEINSALQNHPAISPAVGALVDGLRPRLKDSQAALVIAALQVCITRPTEAATGLGETAAWHPLSDGPCGDIALSLEEAAWHPSLTVLSVRFAVCTGPRRSRHRGGQAD